MNDIYIYFMAFIVNNIIKFGTDKHIFTRSILVELLDNKKNICNSN